MNRSQAKKIFADKMKTARRRQLSTRERSQLARARETLQKKNPYKVGSVIHRSKAGFRKIGTATKSGGFKANPVIYPNVKSIVARKGPGHPCDAACKRANHTYIHRFKPGATMYGNSDGSISIRSRR